MGNEHFTENAGKAFPAGISAWLSKDTLLIHTDFESGQALDTLPIRITYEKINNIVIKRASYISGSGFAKIDYRFNSLSVSKGKLTIFGIDRASVTSMVFPLGAITVYPHAGMISKIEIDCLEKWYTSGGEPMVSSSGFEFIPTESIPLNTLGETGFFLSLK